jgi:hypothetical protein
MKDAMPTPVKRTTKKKSAPVAPENRTPSEIVADAIVTRYKDLAPSVRRIMEAGLGENGQLHAITVFQASLTAPDDPMRNPLNSIAAGREVSETPA